MALNRTLLDCYAKMNPNQYKLLDSLTQRDFCYSQRLQVEEYLIRAKITPNDFFAAAKINWYWLYKGNKDSVEIMMISW